MQAAAGAAAAHSKPNMENKDLQSSCWDASFVLGWVLALPKQSRAERCCVPVPQRAAARPSQPPAERHPLDEGRNQAASELMEQWIRVEAGQRRTHPPIAALLYHALLSSSAPGFSCVRF